MINAFATLCKQVVVNRKKCFFDGLISVKYDINEMSSSTKNAMKCLSANIVFDVCLHFYFNEEKRFF